MKWFLIAINFIPRDDAQTNMYALKLNLALLEEYKQRKLSTALVWYRQGNFDYLNSIKDDIEYCDLRNIAPGFNQLHLLFAWAYEEGLNSFFRALRVDYLHIWLKGWINDCILDTVAVVASVGTYDPAWLDSAATLDRLLIEFQFLQTIHITRHIRWTRGVTLHRSTISGATLTGGIEGWKLPSLMIQLMFCIASNSGFGNTLPPTLH